MKKKGKLIFFTILVLTLVLRLFKLSQLFHFTMDESLIAFRGWGLFKLKRPFLIGGGSPLQVHLPPYFYYLASILLALSSFNPLGWGVWGAILGVLTTITLFYFTKKNLNLKIALTASLLYATSFTAVFFDRHFWPLSLNPLLTLLSLLLLTRLNRKSIWPYFGLALTLVLAFTSDPSNIPLLLTVASFFLVYRKKFTPKFSLTSLITALLFFFTPLIIFDLRHNWVNISGIKNLIQKTATHQFNWQNLINGILLIPRTLTRFIYSPQTNLVEVYSYCIPYADARQKNLPILLLILSVIILIWFIKKAKAPIEKAITYLILFYIFGITLFSSLGYPVFDHYLTGLLPIFAFILAKFIIRLPKVLSFLLLILFLVFNLTQTLKANNPYSLKLKQDLTTWANQQLQGQDFALDSVSKCHKENGLRYLFELTDNPPKQSFMDPNFFWLYRQPPAEKMPDKVLLVTDKTLNTSLSIISQKTFGALNAYILDNQDKAHQFK
ncbi:glycosyltransferase family 39 protein [Patescibacteria group bacterium]